MKLSGRDMYGLWETQMLCLLKSHDMLDLIFKTSPPQKAGKEKRRWLVFRPLKGKGKEKMDEIYMSSWKRSNALVKGWILCSLSEKALRRVVRDLEADLKEGKLEADLKEFKAKHVWDKLKDTYGPKSTYHRLHHDEATSLLPDKENEYKGKGKRKRDVFTRIVDTVVNMGKNKEDDEKKEAEERANVLHKLHKATLSKDFESVNSMLKNRGISVTEQIAINGNTALHVAVATAKNKDFLEKMLKLVPDQSRIPGLVNSDKSTLLHVAAIVGNLNAAKILVNKSPGLLSCQDNDGYTPLTRAASNMHADTYLYLLEETAKISSENRDHVYADPSSDELLVNTFSSRDFGSLQKLLDKQFAIVNSDALLMAMAQNFPSEPIYWGRKKWFQALRTPINWPKYHPYDNICKPKTRYVGAKRMLFLAYARKWIPLLYMAIFSIFVWSKLIHIKDPNHDEAVRLLSKVCQQIHNAKQPNTYHKYYTKPILEAAQQNAYEVVKEIVGYFPNAIWSLNEDGHDIIQLAVIHRSEKVYNLLYQMTEHKNIYRTIKDPLDNNLLHLAARLAPANKLNLISGAALQLQRELQWFEEVKGYVCPLNIIQENCFGETPEMVFTREHKDLVIEGEKWMKATAKSYTITAALIATVMFAAAITVPGGSDQSKGVPIFRRETAFKIFEISDAVSLFTSVTSLLMFLCILTTRFAEGDFLFQLPTKLIIGLVTLFVSTTAMLIAFGATLFLVFGQSNKWSLVPIAAMTCLPITSFVTLQLPLVADLIFATYGSVYFGKESDEPFYSY